MLTHKTTTGFLAYGLFFMLFLLSCQNEPHDNNGYTLIWQDEFDSPGLPDSTKWSYDTAGNVWGWGNNELQFYTRSRKENAMVNNGFLKIIARKEDFKEHGYTSARLVTKYKADWLYGKIEVRAKLPRGRGLWPAIWMLPTDQVYGGWPDSGEIDIMEHVGHIPDSVYFSVHTKSYNHVIGTQKTRGIYIADRYGPFHRFTVEWDKNVINGYLDDLHYFTFKNENSGWQEWPFNKRFHLILNLAVGGNWGGQQGVDDSIFPCSLEVDYVKVYQKLGTE